MALSENAIQAQDDQSVNANSSHTGADLNLSAGAVAREVLVKGVCGGTPDSTDIINVYFQPKADVDQDASDDYVNQGDYLGSLDLNSDNPAIKAFGLAAVKTAGRIVIENEGDTNANTVSARVIEIVNS